MLERELTEGFRAALTDAVRQSFGEADLSGVDVAFAPTPSYEVGDLGFGCFPLAKVLRRSPKEIAERLAEAIVLPAPFREARTAGPYLNVFLDRGAFLERLCREVEAAGEGYGRAEETMEARIALEFSAPNTNKPQHLGHIRNNLVGMALAGILEAAGHDVVKVNLINDRGIHICKSMLAYQRWGEGQTPESAGTKGDHFVGDWYVRFAREAQADPSLNDQAQDMLRRWEEGDPETVELWRTMNQWVYAGFEETYRRLGVTFDRVYHESETYTHGRAIVLDALERGLCTRLDDGAVVVHLSDYGIDKPKILLRRDGTSVYMTQDLGTAVRRVEELGPDRLYYVVGSEQKYHFQVLFAILAKLGYPWAEGCRHISYGMVYLPEGKMKSREGKVVDADDLLDELEAMATDAVREKHPDITDDELAVRKRQIALGALKFYLLNVNLDKDINYDPAASLSFEGDTGPYIQYAHTRICGILRKAADRDVPEPDFAQLTADAELALGLLLLDYPRAVRDAAAACNPARLAGHVLDLARAFASFYHDHPVLQAETPGLVAARLQLIRAAQAVLANGLGLLGIEAPEKM
ncbi:MAG: arginine--tRNA ligase [Planctomycetota bacterium]